MSKRQAKKKRKAENGYVKKEPLYMLYLYSLFGTLIQVIFFTLFYTAFISAIQESPKNNIGFEFLFIFGLFLITDLIELIFIFGFRIYINKKKRFLKREKKRSTNKNRVMIESLLHLLWRSFFFIVGLTSLLSSLLYPYISILWGFIAYFCAWLFVSIMSRSIAFGMSVWFTKSV